MRYLGSKIKLLNHIETIFENFQSTYNDSEYNNQKTIFADLFSGTGVVYKYILSKHPKTLIWANDIMSFSTVINQFHLNNKKDPFKKINEILFSSEESNTMSYAEKIIDLLNNIKIKRLNNEHYQIGLDQKYSGFHAFKNIYLNEYFYYGEVSDYFIYQHYSDIQLSEIHNNHLNNEIYYLLYDFFDFNFNLKTPRKYFSTINAIKIDFIRIQLNYWLDKEWIDEIEYFTLLYLLLEAVSKISNTTGTYDAFLGTWESRSKKELCLDKTLLKQDLQQFINNDKNFHFISQLDNTSEDWKKQAEFILELIKLNNNEFNCNYRWFFYLDPPYNNRQYPNNYHILETISVYNYPKLSDGKTGKPLEMKKSGFSIKKEVEKEFIELFNSIQSLNVHGKVCLSYSSDGLLGLDKIKDIIKKCFNISENNTSKIQVKIIPFKQYQSKNHSKKSNLKEYLIHFDI